MYFNNLKLYGSFWLRGELFTNFTMTTPPRARGAGAPTQREMLFTTSEMLNHVKEKG